MTLPNSEGRHCKICGEKITDYHIEDYCEVCFRNKRKKLAEEKQKHEEVKRMAWEMYRGSGHYYSIETAWQEATKFYNYAKEKQEENDNADT